MLMLAAAVGVLLQAGGDKPRLLLQDLQAGEGADPSVARAVTASVAKEISRRAVHDLVTSADVATLLGAERQRQLMGCGDESASCVAELSGALGARFVMTGAVTRLGTTWQLTLQTVDGSNAHAVGRAVQLAPDVETLVLALPMLVSDATGLPRPPEPSRAGPAVLAGAGIAVVVAGAAVLLESLFRESELSKELDLAVNTPSLLRPATSYESDVHLIVTERIVAGVTLGVGAALAAGGLVWLFLSGSRSGAVAVAPTNGGAMFALQGVWP